MGSRLFDRLKADCADDWRAYTRHRFVEGLGDGSLPEDAFRHYLVQDYLFLIQFARAYALAAYKAQTLADIRAAREGLGAIVDTELGLHVRICARWGLSEADLEGADEGSATLAYTRYVLEAGHAGDLLDLLAALAPCVVGYAEIGRDLAARPDALVDSNPYREWIAEYSSDNYQAVAEAARGTLDRLAGELLAEARYPRLSKLFRNAVRLEADFWEQALATAG